MKRGLTLGVLPIAEVVFLAVGVSEDVITRDVGEEDDSGPQGAQFDGFESEVPCLERIDKGDPRKVTY